MAVRSYAAPPTPWSKSLAEPKIHDTAYVHSFSNLIGDVRIGANVLISPGTSIRADEGNPFYIGDGTNIQDGVVIHGLEQGRVVGDDGESYSVWIGKHSSITHMALIHGPAYVGDDCFVGFRSTIFNARIGSGCIVMMHALVQDVEIPPGRYVPSGSVITTQQQADRLPSVRESDAKFARHVVGINDALRSGYLCAENVACITPIRDDQGKSNGSTNYSSASHSGHAHMDNGSLASVTIEQIRRLLSQGYRVGTEHADERRFQTSSWKSCAPIQSTREYDVFRELESCLAEHKGEYVRLIGIDPKAKKRVLETIIQRPNGKPGQSPKPASYQAPAASYSSQPSQSSSKTGLSSSLADQIRQLLSQGYRIGTEHADERRFQTSSWKSCAPIQSTRESDVFAGLDACLNEHAGEYVRLIGIDPKAKRRVLETIIQRPNGKGGTSEKIYPVGSATSSSGGYSSSSTAGHRASAPSQGLSVDVADHIRQLIRQGSKISVEYADERRFKTSSWQTGAAIQARNESDAISALESLLAEHAGHYVRLIGIDPKAKKRVLEVIVQRPGAKGSEAPKVANPTNTSNGGGRSSGYASSSYGSSNSSSSSSNRLGADVVEHVRQLIRQGSQLSTEYADERRFKTSSWQSVGAIQARSESDAIAALESVLSAHPKDYVRLIGVDSKAKKRVLEAIIQRPGKKG